MPPPPAKKTAQVISANNILGNHEEFSPRPHLKSSALGTTIYDRLASNLGLLRTMFKENAQKPLCPHIDEIGPAIVRAFDLSDPADVQEVYSLLVMSQRATGHAVAEFEGFSKILREHSRKKETGQRKALVKKQQALALRGMKNAMSMDGDGGMTAPSAAGTSSRGAGGRGGPASSSARGDAQMMPASSSSSAAPPPARTQREWAQFLNQFSSKNDQRLNWHEFSGCLHNLPPTWRRGNTLEPNELWSARTFFQSCASVENMKGLESRVSTLNLSSYFVGAKMVARTSKSVALGSTIRSAMTWEDDGGLFHGAAISARGGNTRLPAGAEHHHQQQQQAGGNNNAAPSSARGAASGGPQANRAVRLRNEAQKTWIVAHTTDPVTGNVVELPKIPSAK